MTITVTSPDGSTIDFPDGTDNATIHSVMSQHSEQQAAPQEKPRNLFQTIDDSVRMVAQGATFGFADEFAGQMNHLFGAGERSSNIDQERAKDEAISKRMPVTSAALKILGGVMSPVTKLAGLPGAAVNAPRYLNYAAQGGAMGALAGAGESTEGNRGTGAAIGGTTGAVFGAAFPALAEGVGAVATKVADKVQGPVSGAARRMLRALGRDNMTPDDAAARLQELGPDATLADIGPNMRGLAEASATQPGKSLTAAENLVASRAAGRTERLQKAALESAGVDSLETLIAQRSEAARPHYQKAFSQDNYRTIRSPLIERLMTRPDFQRGVRAGVKDVLDEAAITGDDVHSFNTFFDGMDLNDPNLVLKKEPTLRILDAAKRGMDKILNSDELLNTNGTKKQEWHRLNDMRQSLMKEVDSKLGDTAEGIAYKKAREAWGGPSDAINALAHVEKVASTARDGSDITGRLFGSKAAREKLKGLFSDDESLAAFSKKVANERTMADTERKLTGNSRTAFRNAAQDDLADGGLTDVAFSLAQRPTLGNLAGELALGAKNWLKAPPTKIADEMTGLYSTDPAERNVALEMLRRKTGVGSLLYGQFDKAPNLLSNVGGYSGGLVGGQR